ncbi:MAG: hypothetical protein EA393_05690 [Bacteroidetes bacterium]|nr:MAG: hypothetical protein EA393_05690 [Bacteroidota bacterium]
MKKKFLTLGLIVLVMLLVASPAGAECNLVSFECYEGAGFGYTGYVCGNYFEQQWQEVVYFVEWCVNVW